MLDHYSNQASGLLGLGCQAGPKLIAMVSHGDDQSELPLLWQLCLSWVHLGYSITVLDGTTKESETNPGLEQLLKNTHWPVDGSGGTPAWSVMPSAKGIQELCEAVDKQKGGLGQLQHLVHPEGVLALYCRAEWMTPLLSAWPAEPLLTVSSSQASLLSSYTALKRLLITGRLKPTIVHMLQDSHLSNTSYFASPLSGLVACAKQFLGHECKTLRLRAPHSDTHPSAEVQSLALRLIENALTLGAKDRVTGDICHLTQVRRFDQFAESH